MVGLHTPQLPRVLLHIVMTATRHSVIEQDVTVGVEGHRVAAVAELRRQERHRDARVRNCYREVRELMVAYVVGCREVPEVLTHGSRRSTAASSRRRAFSTSAGVGSSEPKTNAAATRAVIVPFVRSTSTILSWSTTRDRPRS
jgi:hypothetical protein